ncbi:MAG TPA: DUF1028 domain-containing protein [Acidimicrobiales bacterium]|jgi:uncharacterized Ntn-hydrolase superfamily protein|nr:DUF1028 domain-containing protein [Acidimicrobiales bacterium]
MTYSIVAKDAETGQLGVAVQTCTYGVGRSVPWAIAGVGAVATQAMGEPAYGPRCLDAMASGAGAVDALAAARELDGASAIRQVGVVDASGAVDAFTGEMTVRHAGHVTGDGWTIQANMMATPDVWPAMADAYESASGPFGDRLLATLRAGEAAGGDGRGRMSAAMLIVDGDRHDDPWEGRLIDARIDHTFGDPIAELEHVYRAALAYRHFSRGVDTVMTGDGHGALRETEAGLDLLPGDGNLRFLRVGALLATGDVDGGVAEMRELLRERPSWATVARGLYERGFMALPSGVDLEAVLGDGAHQP